MKVDHHFGGSWTERKLSALSKYLTAYMNIFKANERARWFTTNYVDAFAGTGFRSGSTPEPGLVLFEDEEAAELQQGSATVALESSPAFDKYIFVDKKPEHIRALSELKDRYPERNVEIIRNDANLYLPEWCNNTDWERNRAVVFLDPYGTQVDWNTIKAMADTEAVDLWLLFPLGQAVNRMLTSGEPLEAWSARLDRLFGSDDWRDEFYRPSGQESLFLSEPGLQKVADFDAIGRYFVKRLQSVFAEVANNPLALFNSKNIPIYLLCFAAANPKGAKTAIKIADHILRQ